MSTMKGTDCEDLLDLLRHRAARRGVGPIDLGQQRRQHRRPGRHFDDLDDRCRPATRAPSVAPQIERDRRGSCGCGRLWRDEIDLQFAEFRQFAA